MTTSAMVAAAAALRAAILEFAIVTLPPLMEDCVDAVPPNQSAKPEAGDPPIIGQAHFGRTYEQEVVRAFVQYVRFLIRNGEYAGPPLRQSTTVEDWADLWQAGINAGIANPLPAAEVRGTASYARNAYADMPQHDPTRPRDRPNNFAS